MRKFLQKLRFIFDDTYFDNISAGRFAAGHPNLLIIIGDPKTDVLFAAHKNKVVTTKIKSATGKNTHVVKNVLTHSLFKTSINDLVVAIVETLHLPLPRANQFFMWLDGAVFNIAKSLRDDRKEKEAPKVPEGIPSPFNVPGAKFDISN